MSLVALKNFLWRANHTNTETRRSMFKQQCIQSSGDSVGTITGTDIEAQQRTPLLGYDRAVSQPEAFKINARVISDATIGLSDGLTVPFALTAGLSALGDTRVVIFGSLAELIAGAISMGLGGYLGAKSELASYQETRSQTEQLVNRDPKAVVAEIRDVFAPYSLPPQTLDDLASHLSASPRLVDFAMQFQHCAQEPASSRALTSAITIALGYFLGGMLPLVPYFWVGKNDLLRALYISVGVMAVALFSFGYVKTCIVTGWRGSKYVRQGVFGGIQMVIIGGAAAGAAMGLVKTFNELVDT